MKDNSLINILTKLELFLYSQADLVIAVTHSFKLELQNRGVSDDKIEVVLNGVDVSKYKPSDEKDKGFPIGINYRETCGWIYRYSWFSLCTGYYY